MTRCMFPPREPQATVKLSQPMSGAERVMNCKFFEKHFGTSHWGITGQFHGEMIIGHSASHNLLLVTVPMISISWRYNARSHWGQNIFQRHPDVIFLLLAGMQDKKNGCRTSIMHGALTGYPRCRGCGLWPNKS
jgi:hypothetical protein